MPDHYVAIEGTAELMVRKRVADAVQQGWRLSQPNEMPMKVPRGVRFRKMGILQQASRAPVAPEEESPAVLQDVQPQPVEEPVERWYAVNSKTGVSHVYSGVGEKSLCRRFRCGTLWSPSTYAIFYIWSQKPDLEACPLCASRI